MDTSVDIDDAIEEFLVSLSRKNETKAVKKDYQFILNLYGLYSRLSLLDDETSEGIALFFNYLQGRQYNFIPGYIDKHNRIPERARYEQAIREIFMFYEWASEKYLISNPFIPKNIVEYSERIPVLQKEEIRCLSEILQSNLDGSNNARGYSIELKLRDQALFGLLVDTGVLPEELSKLVVQDVIFDENLLIIREMTGHEHRKVHFGERTTKVLFSYLVERHANKIPGDAPLILSNNKKLPLDREELNVLLKKWGDIAGVENLYALRFRAFLAHNLRREGYSFKPIARYLGMYPPSRLLLYLDKHEDIDPEILRVEYQRATRKINFDEDEEKPKQKRYR